jgi:hypothetical protein
VRALHRPAGCGLDGRGHALAGDRPREAALLQQGTARCAVVAAVQVDRAVRGQAVELVQPGQRRPQQRRVVPVGPGGDQVQGDAGPVGRDGALEPLFAPVHRRASGRLAPARRLGGAAVHGHVLQLQADHPVVGPQRQRVQLLAQAGRGPLLQAAADGAVRAAGRGDALVAGAVDQRGDDVVEDDAIRDAPAVAPQRVGGRAGGARGQQGGELVPHGLQQAYWQGGHGLLR